MAIERRRARRIKVNLPMRISYPGNPQICTQTENISILGAYVEIGQQIPLGTELHIIIEIPAYTNETSLTGDVNCRGNVFRCNLIQGREPEKIYGLGIFFTDFFSEEDRNKLSKYIDFLILKEQEDIKIALKKWRDKRGSKARR